VTCSAKQRSPEERLESPMKESSNVLATFTLSDEANARRTVTDTSFLRPTLQDHRSVALRVAGLTKRYGTTTAVAGLNFEVREGEMFGLPGPNGAGKRTTIAMIATQRTPSGGDVRLFGHSARREPTLVRQMLGLAPQEVSLYPALTAAENLQFFGRIYELT